MGQEEKDVMVAYQCEHCYGTQQADGSIKWGCDAIHAEVLAQMDRCEREEDEDSQSKRK